MARTLLSLFFLTLLVGAIGSQAFAKDDDGFFLWRNKKTIAADAMDTDPLTDGDRAPFGTLVSTEGGDVDFEDFIRHKPTLFFFYEGGWSDMANELMDRWVKLVPRLTVMGYQLAAISPDKPAELKAFSLQHRLNFPVFCDPDMDVTRRFGIAYRPDDEAFKRKGIDLKAYTGHAVSVLPLPSIFGIDRNGFVRFAYFYPNEGFLDHPDRLLKRAQETLKQYP